MKPQQMFLKVLRPTTFVALAAICILTIALWPAANPPSAPIESQATSVRDVASMANPPQQPKSVPVAAAEVSVLNVKPPVKAHPVVEPEPPIETTDTDEPTDANEPAGTQNETISTDPLIVDLEFIVLIDEAATVPYEVIDPEGVVIVRSSTTEVLTIATPGVHKIVLTETNEGFMGYEVNVPGARNERFDEDDFDDEDIVYGPGSDHTQPLRTILTGVKVGDTYTISLESALGITFSIVDPLGASLGTGLNDAVFTAEYDGKYHVILSEEEDPLHDPTWFLSIISDNGFNMTTQPAVSAPEIVWQEPASE